MSASLSIVGRIAFGPNEGAKVTMIASWFAYYEEFPLSNGQWYFSIRGYSFGANSAPNN
jgi:hypothetical protein